MNKKVKILLVIVSLILSGVYVYAQDLPTACGNGEVTYGVFGDNGNSFFDWEVTGGEIVKNYNDSIVVKWNGVAGMHFITVTETNIFGCEGEPYKDTVIVTMPFVDLGFDAEICEGESYEFIAAASDVTSYLWEDGSDGETFIATKSGNYWVRVEDEFGCTNSDTAALIAHELPIIDLGPDTTLCGELEGLVLDVYQDGISLYEWSTGDFGSSITAYPQTSDQEIWVSVTTENGCLGGDTLVIRFCGDFEIPNAFTPNDDGSNDRWEIEELFSFEKVTVDIYNRWGERVFHSNGYSSDQYWDGTNEKGTKLPMDSYYYVIDLGNDEEPIVGTVTLIR